MTHDTFCKNKELDFFTSDCEPACEYRRQAVAECVELGEHMRMTTIDPTVGDVCFNCGTAD